MAELKFEHIYKVYDGGKAAVSDFCLDVADGEFVVIVGPSGCGKTTTLRMVAGLEKITRGKLYIDGELANAVKPDKRGAAMVFQGNALFPQMTVYDNMAFGLSVKKTDKAETDRRVRAAAEVLGISDVLTSRPSEISGGQCRRAALGRALVDAPRVFLLDEPLSGLDAQLRAEMRGEILRLHRAAGTTFIYVTHDQAEAMTMGTRIVVMRDGKIQQADAPDAVYERPANKFTAGFLGSPQMNFFSGRLQNNGAELEVVIDGAPSVAKLKQGFFGTAGDECAASETPLTFGFRPNAISTVRADKKLDIAMNLTISYSENLGSERYVYGDINGTRAVFKARDGENYRGGEDITVYLDLARAHVFDAQTEDSII